MKGPIKSIRYLVLLIAMVFITSCSDDPMPTLDIANFNVTVDENQADDAVLGSVAATGTDGPFAYSITSQSPTGSIAIDADTGEITVLDAAVFDFETNPTITATISVTGNSITESANVNITLNDIDDIEFFLTDSKNVYAAAAIGDWIAVTQTEYDNLASKLNSVSRVGTTETLYTAAETDTNTTDWTVANDAGSNIPTESYVIAFKYYLNSGSDVTGFKVKQSETINDGYTDLGSNLPIHSGTEESMCFVLKGSSAKLNAEGYLAFYKPSGANMGISTGQNYYFAAGDVNTGFTQFAGYLHYQGLSTPQIQW